MSAARSGYSSRSRLDKLGVKPGAAVAVLGLDDAEFDRELATRTSDVALRRPRRGTDLVLFAVTRTGQLERLTRLKRALAANGAIWVLWPKGRKVLREDDVRGAALAVGLVDVKVASFSEFWSALKLVIPLNDR